ncbi:MAG: HupE/UreJ family protein [Bacteroidia bacterium]|nr:HupE/UreJ family protein [Bacteroidia bacterium]
MSIFQMYLNLGIQHIADYMSFDHILFITCLCAVYIFKQWKQILVLITAFTIGHTTSLLLSTFNIISISTSLIEFLIPLTIFITAFWNLFLKQDGVNIKTHWFKYITALFFGLIHGMGFSNYLQTLLGIEKSILMPLFSFNLGIEIGQIIIVSIILILSYIITSWFKVARRDWVLIFSGAGLGVSLTLMIERFPSQYF